MKIIKFLKDIIAPKKCYSCNIEWHFLCLACFRIQHNFHPICYSCKGPSENFSLHKWCSWDVFYDKVIILTHYSNEVIQKLIKDAKFYNKKDIFEDFGRYLAKSFIKNEIYTNRNDYIIISVPMFFTRKLKRGYNQSDILAKYISNKLKIEYDKNILKRVKNTRQQSKLSKNIRLKNLENSFKINKKYLDKLDNKKVILVDDVISTGTTINVISKLLKENWVKEVIGLVIASD